MFPLTAKLQLLVSLVSFPGRAGKRLGGAQRWAGAASTAPSALPTPSRPRRCGDPGFAGIGHVLHGGQRGKGGHPSSLWEGRPRIPALSTGTGSASSLSLRPPLAESLAAHRPAGPAAPRGHTAPAEGGRRATGSRSAHRRATRRPARALFSSRYHDGAGPPRLPRGLRRNAGAPSHAARVRPGPAEPQAEPGHGPGGRASGEAGRAASAAERERARRGRPAARWRARWRRQHRAA